MQVLRLPPTDPHPKKQVTTLTADMVLAKINRDYLPGLRRCYQKNLVHDASLSGKIAVTLAVDGSGAVVAPSASGVSDEVDSCVQNLMTAWSFPGPRDPAGNPATAHFHLSLVLDSN